jgi:hypothetical protein
MDSRKTYETSVGVHDSRSASCMKMDELHELPEVAVEMQRMKATYLKERGRWL